MGHSFGAVRFGISGLRERESLLDAIETYLAEDADAALGLICVEISRFRLLTETFGSEAVRSLLRQAAERLTAVCAEASAIGVLAEDCFAIVMRRTTLPDAHRMARRAVESLEPAFSLEDFTLELQSCAGVTCAAGAATSLTDLIDHVAVALGKARDGGVGAVAAYGSGMERDVAVRHSIARDFCAALARDEIDLHYQPIVGAQHYDWVGCEALARWRHPRHGNVSPALFIPMAEELGLIQTLTERAISRVCEQAVRWPEHMFVAVNVSPKALNSRAIVRGVEKALATTGLDPRRLEIEITEGVALKNKSEIVAALAALGVRIALDDFGTGVSNLAYLRSLAFQKIKIDRSFVVDCLDKRDAAAIVGAIVHLATALGADVTAEGIETIAQADRLRQMGCTELQGFLFGQPLPADELLGLISSPCSQARVSSGFPHHV